MGDNWFFYVLYALVVAAPLGLYIRRQVKREVQVREAVAAGQVFSEGPRGQHPHIDVSHCIGCQTCTAACPEGTVLGMVGGKAAVIQPHRCIGHGLCADVCPVGAIQMVFAAPGISADLPYLTSELETSVPNLYIAGELGGLALIKNAVNQGRDCMDNVAARLASEPAPEYDGELYDVLIIGAGPAGISASLRAIERGLKYLTIERDTLGGSVSKYPRQKLVMTSPVEFPLGKTLKKMALSKEALLEFWGPLCSREDFHVHLNETVETIGRGEDGIFRVRTPKGEYCSRAVVLALGRAGTPRKLDVKGEELPKVMYRLIEADHYVNSEILVVGGGDSAVEAAMGLAAQRGNHVTLSYRKSSFGRIKERNVQRLRTVVKKDNLEVIFNSMPVEFTEKTVILEVEGERREIPNDYVWVFAGGVAPNDFLKSIGIGFGPRDLTRESVQEAAAAGSMR
ncbi:MAG: NAD(P)-binding domain-containing protein [Acidobacteria bacterium]|nr:NAD(P)-binding domain-containing protein [Acidobacteriota bacterium]